MRIKIKKKLLIIILFIIFCTTVPSAYSNTEYSDLYHVKYKNNWLYLDENGNTSIKIPVKKFDDVGNFTEGRGFVTKKIKDIEYDEIGADYYYKLVNLAIIDSRNNIIKKFDGVALILDDDSESNGSYIPEFYKGYARIQFVENKNIKSADKYSKLKLKDKYVDKNGNFVNKKDIPKDIKSMLDDELIARYRYEYNQNLIPKEMKCMYPSESGCFAYVDKNDIIKIYPIWNSDFTGCGDWFARNPYFYNNRAVAFVPKGKADGFYIFINTEGKPINNVGYSYVEPFYRKLTMVIFKNGEQAYINTSGKVVWSEKIQLQKDKFGK